MGNVASNPGASAMLKYVGVFALVGGIWYATSQQGRKLTRTDLLALLVEMSLIYHTLFTELAVLTQNMKKVMKSRGLENKLSDEDIGAIVLQEGIGQRLALSRRDLINKYKTTDALLEAVLAENEADPEVQVYVKGFEKMCATAKSGALPLLTNKTLPAEFDEAKVLEIVAELNAEKQAAFTEHYAAQKSLKVDNNSSPEELAELQTKLQILIEEAEQKVVARHSDICPDINTFQHAIAFHSFSPKFVNQKNLMDQLHMDKMTAILRPENTDSAKDFVVASITSNIDEVMGADLPAILISAEANYVMCLILKKDAAAERKILEAYSQTVERLTSIGCSFVYLFDTEARICPEGAVKSAVENDFATDKYLVFKDSKIVCSSSDVSVVESFVSKAVAS